MEGAITKDLFCNGGKILFKLNGNINKIINDNEFFTASKIVNEYKKNNPNKKILSLGIGDVSKSIIKPVIQAMQNAVNDLYNMDTFRGYGPSHGYDFLKELILKNDYKGFLFTKDEIYISNGVKTDICSILELFDIRSKIAIVNPVYPIYKNGALCLNRKKINYIEANEADGFIANVPNKKFDIIYLCSPNNPIGIAYDYCTLKRWVDYALHNKAIILYDNSYYKFIRSSDVPHSIYEVEGAEKVAIEFRSFSKSISFTGIRCSYYIIPNKICANINEIWKKRTINRFNGADYIAQKGAAASYQNESEILIKENIDDYMNNTKVLKNFFVNLGFRVYGGEDCPFIWVKIKDNLSSWELFKLFLEQLNIVVTPGIIFGKQGDKFIRISGLASKETIDEAMERIKGFYEEEEK